MALIGLHFQGGLRSAAWRSNPVGLAVVIRVRALDDAVDVVVIRNGCGQRLQHDGANSLGKNGAVGAAVERKTFALGREHVHLRKADMAVRRVVHRGGTDDGHPQTARLQMETGFVHRNQAGGTTRLDANAWPLPIKQIRKTRGFG